MTRLCHIIILNSKEKESAHVEPNAEERQVCSKLVIETESSLSIDQLVTCIKFCIGNRSPVAGSKLSELLSRHCIFQTGIDQDSY
jgi:hypothetical protein